MIIGLNVSVPQTPVSLPDANRPEALPRRTGQGHRQPQPPRRRPLGRPRDRPAAGAGPSAPAARPYSATAPSAAANQPQLPPHRQGPPDWHPQPHPEPHPHAPSTCWDGRLRPCAAAGGASVRSAMVPSSSSPGRRPASSGTHGRIKGAPLHGVRHAGGRGPGTAATAAATADGERGGAVSALRRPRPELCRPRRLPSRGRSRPRSRP